ncbi:MAG TPA: hypothetical protein VK752_19010 [Bryobacteraceae bacterium]|jgi:hypothetical protein|nr:hypothetical protein [Bryobacteraceae bacterium]
MLFRAVLLLAVAVHVLGQPALKELLGLTEMQIWQLQQQAKPVPIAPPGRALGYRPGIPTGHPPMDDPASLQRALQNPILDASQQAKLAEIVKVLSRSKMASDAIVAGLIDVKQWPGSTLCFYYPIYALSTSEFHFSDSQVQQLDRLQRAAREPLEKQIAIAAQPAAGISKLREQLAATRPPRDLALAVLNEAQKAQLATFVTDLGLVREAIELKLIPDPPKGEVLCQ